MNWLRNTTRTLLLLGLISLGACRSRKADLGMSDSAFVQVMAELKAVADDASITEVVRGQRRDAVLRKRGVSAAQIEGLAPTLTAHARHARDLWAAIDMKAMRMSQVKNHTGTAPR
jgi:hypothetical protein